MRTHPLCSHILSQVVLVIPTVYNIEVPDFYTNWMDTFEWLEIKWYAVLNLECYAKTFGVSTFMMLQLLRCVLPFIICVLVLLSGYIIAPITRLVQKRRALKRASQAAAGLAEDTDSESLAEKRPSINDVLFTLPAALFVTFIFMPHAALGVFALWNCVPYETRDAELGGKQSVAYLQDDAAIRCDGSDDEYAKSQTLAITFLFIWPIFVPLAFWMLVFKCRKPVITRRPTALSRACVFLFKEYNQDHMWWEPVDILRKLLLTGFILLIPQDAAFLRLFTAMFITFTYLLLLLVVQPFKRFDNHACSVGRLPSAEPTP